MKAKADPEFWRRYNKLPARIQELARKNYALWLANPFHPSLQFKQVSRRQWSARVGLHYRATGHFLTPDIFVWDWIGTHEEYNTKNTTNSDTRYAFAGSQKSESAPGAEENSPPIHRWVERVGINARPLPHPPTLRYGAVQIDSRFEAKRRRKERGNCPPVAVSGFGLRASFGFRHSDFGFPSMSLLEVKNLKVHFPVKPGMFSRVREFVKAVDGVRFGIEPGETLGLVGESGCGQTMPASGAMPKTPTSLLVLMALIRCSRDRIFPPLSTQSSPTE